MKKTTQIPSVLAAFALLGALIPSTFAASGNWNVDAAGNWSTAANWSPAAVPGTAAGDVVGLTFNITAARTVTIDTTSRTVGTLNIGDPTTSFFAYTLAASGGAGLTFNNGGSGATLGQAVTTASDVISTPITLADNLTVNNSSTLTLSGVISGTGFGITKSTGTGTLILTGNNSYTGGTVVNSGILSIGNGTSGSENVNAMGTGLVTVNTGATNKFAPNGTTTAFNFANNFAMNGGTVWGNDGNQHLGTGGGATINIGASGGTFDAYWSGKDVYLDGQLTGSGPMTVRDNNGGNSFSGGIIYVTGGANTYNGTVTVQSKGYLGIGNSAALSSATVVNNSTGNTGSSALTTASGLIFYTGASQVTSATLGTLAGSGNLILQAGTAANGGAVNLTVDGNNTDSIYTGTISGSGSLTKNGADKFTLAGINTFTGGFAINAGTLQISNATAQTFAGPISGSGVFVKNGAGVLTLAGANSISGSMIVSNGTLLVAGSSGQSLGSSLTVKDGATLGVIASADAAYLSPSSLTLGNTTGATLQFGVYGTTTAPLNPTTLTLNGTTTINISSAPFVSGVTYPLINNYASGTLVLGTQPTGVQGQLTFSGSTVNYQVTNVVFDVWTASVNTNWDTTTANWTNNLGGNLFAANYPVQFDDSATGSSPLLVYISSAMTPATVIVSNVTKSYTFGGSAIAGTAGLTKLGSSTLTLTNPNTFTGPITISAGTLALSGPGQLGGGTYANSISDNTLLNYGSAVSQTLSGVISGNGALVNSGTGTLTVSAANSYSGGTTNTSGLTLAADANAFGSGTITMNGGAMSLTTAAALTIANPIYVVAGTTNSLGYASGNKDMTLSGAITGSGTLQNFTNAPSASSSVKFATTDFSGFTGTLVYNGPASGNGQNWRLGSASSTLDASQANFIINGGTGKSFAFIDGISGATLRMGSLSGTGVILGSFQSSGTTSNTLEIGALNTTTTFSGGFGIVASGNQQSLSVTKVGTGTLILGGNNSLYTGPTTLAGGVVSLATNNLASSGPLGANTAPITFVGGLLQHTALNTNDYSARIAGSTSPIAIDVNGTTTTYSNAIAASNIGGLLLTNSTGAGKLLLAASNVYSGATFINAGTLALIGGGNIALSTNISVSAGATYDVSAITYTLGNNQSLSGSGTVTGAVATAGITSTIIPAGVGTVGTLTFKNNLNLSSGAAPAFDVSTSAASGNDKVIVNGNLTLGSSDTIHINALSGAANLDQSADYVLFNVTGSTTMTTQPSLAFDNTPPANAAHYSIKTSGNNVVLRYSASTAPIIASVVVTNTTDGNAVAVRGQSVTVYVIVTPGVGSVTNVSANLNPIGGSASQTLTPLGGNNYSYTLQVGPGATLGADTINVTATDTTPLSGSGSAVLTVNASTETWNGLGANDNWSSGANWVSAYPPGYVGDALVFTGSTRTTPNMDNNYSVAGLTFDSSASSFTLGVSVGKSLTLAGGITNSSSSAQVLNLPVVLSGTQTIEDQGSAGITLAGVVSGSGLNVSAGSVTLSGANTYTGNTTIAGGTLKLANSSAIPSGSSAGNVSVTGTLDLNATSATINGLSGASGSQILNNGGSAATLTVGANDQAGTWGGYISDGTSALTLAKTGTNTLTLSSVNAHSGGTMLNNGSLVYQNAGAFGSGTLTLAGGNLVKSGGALSVPNAVNVSGSVNYVSSSGGDPVLTGAFTGSGTFSILNVAAAGINPGSSSLKIEGDISGFTGTFSDVPGNNRMRFGATGAGSIVIDGSNAKFVTSGSTSTGNPLDVADNTYGTFKMGELSGTGGRLLAGWSSGGNTIFEIGALNTSTTYAGVIQDNVNGSGGLAGVTKVGTGTLTLSGACNYSAATTVSAGVLNVSSLKNGAGDFTVANGATLGVNLASAGTSLRVSTLTLGNNCTNSFTGISSTTVPAITNAGALTLSGTVTVNVQGSLAVAQYPLIASAGGISGSGGFVVGTLPLGATASIITNGNTIVLNVTTAASVQLWTGTADGNWDAVTINWSLNGNPVTYSNALGVLFNDSSSRTNVSLLTNVSPMSVTVANSTRDYTFSNVAGAKLTGITGITKSGSGKLDLTGTSNDFTGGVTISGGTVVVSSNANLGSASGTVALNGTLSTVQGFALSRTLAIGPGTGSGNGVLNVPSGVTLTNNNVMPDNGSGSGTLVKTGSGTLQLAGNSTYTGGTVVSNGTLVLASGGATGTVRGALTINSGATVQTTVNDAIGYNTVASPVNIYGGTLDNASGVNCGLNTTFNLRGGLMTNSVTPGVNNGFDFGSAGAINSLAANIVSTISGQVILRADPLTITTDQGTVPGGTDLIISGTIGQLGGAYGITKDGPGTLELTGTNTYAGMTTVSNGTLRVDGNGSLTGAVAVNGGVFGGTGTVNGAVTVNSGGTLSPGASIGTLTINNNLALAGNTLVELNKSLSPAQSNDIVNVTGTLTYGGTLTVNNLGPALAAGNSFRIFKSGGTGSLTVSGSAGSGLAFSFNDGVLSVVTAGPSGPGTITNSVSGNTLNLNWPAGQGWRLESQTNNLSTGLNTTGWGTVPGAADGSYSATLNPANPTVFYRLVYP